MTSFSSSEALSKPHKLGWPCFVGGWGCLSCGCGVVFVGFFWGGSVSVVFGGVFVLFFESMCLGVLLCSSVSFVWGGGRLSLVSCSFVFCQGLGAVFVSSLWCCHFGDYLVLVMLLCMLYWTLCSAATFSLGSNFGAVVY